MRIVFSVIGIGFLVLGSLLTALNMLERAIDPAVLSRVPQDVLAVAFLLMGCFVALNAFVGFGFLRQRLWTLGIVMISFAALTVFNIGRYFDLFPPGAGSASWYPSALFAVLGMVLYAGRRALSGELWKKNVIIPFVVLLMAVMTLETMFAVFR